MSTSSESSAGSAAGPSAAGPSAPGPSAANPAGSAATSATAGDSAPTFEQTLAQLERLVAQLESGDLPLDVALRTFEQGVRLTRDCQATLSAAQQKVHLLLQRGETAVLEEFDTAGSSLTDSDF